VLKIYSVAQSWFLANRIYK